MLVFKFLIFLLIDSLYIYRIECQNEPTLNIPLGKIKGSILTSRLGKDIFSFRSIRYAEPPTGELRFRPPVPTEKWDGIYDATQPGPVCPQPRNQNSSEDCLMLNVYTNKLPSKPHLKRPVFIFFHPGGFYGSSGASYTFGPQYLLDQDIILVTANYRLASLGFLSTGTKEAPGNNGFKDQVLVLKWVRDNIEAFGGDPNRVTLGGYSAGAQSTALHLVSQMSRGLFHRAIIMSSSPFGQATIASDQNFMAVKQAQLLNCPDDTPANIINCLKTKSAQEIADTLSGFNEVGGDPISRWRAVIEPDFGQERFITEHPVTSLLHGRFANVPVLVGVNEFEFGYVSYLSIRNPERLNAFTNDYQRILPIIFAYERNTTRSNEISTSLKRFYLGDGRVDNTSRLGIEHLYTDGVTQFPINRGVKLISEKNVKDTFYYCFTYRGRYSYFYLPDSNGTKTAGAVHHDELIYLFYIPSRFPLISKDDPESGTVDRMVKMWTDFVKAGNPIPQKSKLLNEIEWIPYKKTNPKYMDIGDKLVMKENLNEDRYKIWEKLFPLSNYV